jgi:hypothetical protein
MAQLVEQMTLNHWVPGSSPGGCTTKPLSLQVNAALLFYATGIPHRPAAVPEGKAFSNIA